MGAFDKIKKALGGAPEKAAKQTVKKVWKPFSGEEGSFNPDSVLESAVNANPYAYAARLGGEQIKGLSREFLGGDKPQEDPELPAASTDDPTERRRKLLEQQRRNAPGIRQQSVFTPRSN